MRREVQLKSEGNRVSVKVTMWENRSDSKSHKQCLSTTGGIDFNASNITGVYVGSQSSLTLSVPVVNDDLDEGGRGE